MHPCIIEIECKLEIFLWYFSGRAPATGAPFCIKYIWRAIKTKTSNLFQINLNINQVHNCDNFVLGAFLLLTNLKQRYLNCVISLKI